MNLVDYPIDQLQLNKELTAEGFTLESIAKCMDGYEAIGVNKHGCEMHHPMDHNGMHFGTRVIARRIPEIQPSLDDFEVLAPSGESRKVLGVFPFPNSALRWVIIEDIDGDPQALLLSSEPINTEGRYRLQRKPKKRKAVFIKTLKELVDSGWDLDDTGEYLRFPGKNYAIGVERFNYLGKERDRHPDSSQQDWFWPAEALIGKEVVV